MGAYVLHYFTHEQNKAVFFGLVNFDVNCNYCCFFDFFPFGLFKPFKMGFTSISFKFWNKLRDVSQLRAAPKNFFG